MEYRLVIQDDEGTLELLLEPATDQRLVGVTRLYPPKWLGDHHPSLERFRWELQAHGLDDPLAAEAWARDKVLELTTNLSDGLWSIFNYEVHKDDSPDAAQPARQLPAPDGAGQ